MVEKPFKHEKNKVYTSEIDRPFTSSAVTNQKLHDQRISAKKLQEVQEWLNEQIIKRNEMNNYVSIKAIIISDSQVLFPVKILN